MSLKNKILNFIGFTPERNVKNIGSFLSREQVVRVRQDVYSWRQSMKEAEAEWYPFRVKMHNLYMDTILNGHVFSCIQKRKNLTLLKGFAFYKPDGSVDEVTTLLFKKKWFSDVINYTLDAELFGYTLISFGDVVNGNFPDLKIVRRQNVSPDRFNISHIMYGVEGVNFNEEPFKDWCLYVSTPSEVGISNCGYGLLYKVALYEIFCRNVLGFNGDYVELFGQPIRQAKTSKQGTDRQTLEETMRDMGASPWLVSDPEDEILLIEPKNSGTGWQSYESLEKRCEKKISKILLGHSDAIDSQTGKLGSSEEIQKALNEVESTDGKFVENVINTDLLPKLRNIGFRIPNNVEFRFKNDKEREETRKKEDESNKACADIVKTLSDSGFVVDEKYIIERTNIPVKAKEDYSPTSLPGNIKNKLKSIYG